MRRSPIDTDSEASSVCPYPADHAAEESGELPPPASAKVVLGPDRYGAHNHDALQPLLAALAEYGLVDCSVTNAAGPLFYVAVTIDGAVAWQGDSRGLDAATAGKAAQAAAVLSQCLHSPAVQVRRAASGSPTYAQRRRNSTTALSPGPPPGHGSPPPRRRYSASGADALHMDPSGRQLASHPGQSRLDQPPVGPPLRPPGEIVRVSCPNAWCQRKGEALTPADFAAHRSVCAAIEPASCIKCAKELTRATVRKHEAQCHAVQCPSCGEKVIGRLLPHCPRQMRRPRLPRRPPGRGAERAARVLQSQWRRWRVRKCFYGVAFSIIWKELDWWEERTSRAHRSESPQKRSQLDAPASADAHAALARAASISYPPRGLRQAPPEVQAAAIRTARNALTHRGPPLSAAFADALLAEAEEYLRVLPNVQRAALPVDSTGKFIVVGDLHGQGADLENVLALNGLPSSVAHFVFNGDLVDRGPDGSEVLFTVLVLMLARPGRVWINRGNHEAWDMNLHYGFVEEVERKYGPNLYARMLRVFCALPLCTVIEDQIMVVHAGLPRDACVTLDTIDRDIDRFRDVPVLSNTVADRAFTDLLWGDPVDTPGASWEPNKQRGVSVVFRNSVTECFLDHCKLSTVIRSHEYPPAGYSFHHQGKIITVFSASNYAGVDMNAAAVARIFRTRPGGTEGVLSRGDLAIDFETWKHWVTPCEPPLAPGGSPTTPTYGRNQQESREAEVLRQLRERVATSAPQLMSLFNTVDNTHTGSVWKTEWVHVMHSLLDASVPWFFLRRYLADADRRTGRIPYSAFIHRYGVPLERTLWRTRWETRALAWLMHRCRIKGCTLQGLLARHQLQGAAADGSRSGMIGYDQFFRIVTHDLGATVTSRTVLLLFRTFDAAGTGFITADSLAAAERRSADAGFVLQERKSDRSAFPTPVTDDTGFFMWDIWLLRRLRALLRRLRPARAWALLDHDCDGELSISDLRAAVARLKLPPGFSKLQTYHLGSGEGRDTVAELFGVTPVEVQFVPAPEEPGPPGSPPARPKKRALVASVQTWPLSATQLERFRHSLDADGDGVVGYADFVDAFYVSDLDHPDDPAGPRKLVSVGGSFTFSGGSFNAAPETPPPPPTLASAAVPEFKFAPVPAKGRQRSMATPPSPSTPQQRPAASPPSSPRLNSPPPGGLERGRNNTLPASFKVGCSADELRCSLAAGSASPSPRGTPAGSPPASPMMAPGGPAAGGRRGSAAEAAGWTVHDLRDAFAGKNASSMKADDVSACRRECEAKGYGGFAVWRGKAYFRAQPPAECLAAMKPAKAAIFHLAPTSASPT
eukprot:TRINITY_DN11214_c0_g1_i1.p1 TRINITY_DN11214_c0_g1~~TRINITY_DN11214_c0_g1_i1.p1  ORF type:complete len:1360 (+),score=375.89 TRINITY_DN11214_c0_g1_i1:120-4082(+)